MPISPTQKQALLKSRDTIYFALHYILRISGPLHKHAIYRINASQSVAQGFTFMLQEFFVLIKQRGSLYFDNSPSLIAFTFKNTFSLLIWGHVFFVKWAK